MRLVILSLAAACLALASHGQHQASSGSNQTDGRYAEAISAILLQDEQLGGVRNHAPERISLALSIRNYVNGLDQLDFDACPDEFTLAFQRHRDAWAASIGFFEQFDELRGELHEIWDLINRGDESQQAAFRKVSQPIAETWSEVETAANKYRAKNL